jgi:hypothetical protein
MYTENFLKLISGDVASGYAKASIDIAYLFKHFDVEPKKPKSVVKECAVKDSIKELHKLREALFDRIENNKKACKWDKKSLDDMADELGYVLVPKSELKVAKQLSNDVTNTHTHQEKPKRELRPDEVFEVPQYEKEQGFSPEFTQALIAFLKKGWDETSGRFVFTETGTGVRYHFTWKEITRYTDGDVVITTVEKDLHNHDCFSLMLFDKIELDVSPDEEFGYIELSEENKQEIKEWLCSNEFKNLAEESQKRAQREHEEFVKRTTMSFEDMHRPFTI